MPITTQVNNTQVNNTQANQVSTTSNRSGLNLLKAVIGDGAVYRFVERLFIGKQPGIVNRPLDLHNPMDKKTAEAFWGTEIPALPESPSGEAGKRVEVKKELAKEVSKDNAFLLRALEVVNKMVDDAQVKKLIEGRFKELFEEIGNDLSKLFDGKKVSDNEKVAFQKVVEERLEQLEDRLVNYARAFDAAKKAKSTKRPDGEIEAVRAEKKSVIEKLADMKQGINKIKAELPNKLRDLQGLESSRELLSDEIEFLKELQALNPTEKVNKLKQADASSRALIDEMKALEKEAQKKLDTAKAENDINTIMSTKADIKKLNQLIEKEDSEVLQLLPTLLDNFDLNQYLVGVQEKFGQVEQNIQKMKEEIRSADKINDEYVAKQKEYEDELMTSLLAAIDHDVVGGLFALLDNFKEELALKRDYPEYPLLRTYNEMAPEELNDRHAGELYADYLAIARLGLEKAQVGFQRSAPPNPGV